MNWQAFQPFPTHALWKIETRLWTTAIMKWYWLKQSLVSCREAGPEKQVTRMGDCRMYHEHWCAKVKLDFEGGATPTFPFWRNFFCGPLAIGTILCFGRFHGRNCAVQTLSGPAGPNFTAHVRTSKSMYVCFTGPGMQMKKTWTSWNSVHVTNPTRAGSAELASPAWKSPQGSYRDRKNIKASPNLPNWMIHHDFTIISIQLYSSW